MSICNCSAPLASNNQGVQEGCIKKKSQQITLSNRIIRMQIMKKKLTLSHAMHTVYIYIYIYILTLTHKRKQKKIHRPKLHHPYSFFSLRFLFKVYDLCFYIRYLFCAIPSLNLASQSSLIIHLYRSMYLKIYVYVMLRLLSQCILQYNKNTLQENLVNFQH